MADILKAIVWGTVIYVVICAPLIVLANFFEHVMMDWTDIAPALCTRLK